MIEELQKSKHELYCKLVNARNQLDLARQLAHSKEEAYNKVKAKHMKVDLELAMLDGRFQKVELSKTKPKKSIAKLTKEQVLRIAEKLGVEVQVEED